MLVFNITLPLTPVVRLRFPIQKFVRIISLYTTSKKSTHSFMFFFPPLALASLYEILRFTSIY
jgi:hypothetical protein